MNGIELCKKIRKDKPEDENFEDLLNNSTILDKTTERKGKPAEKRGRKTTGLKLKSHDSRVAEHL